MKTRLVLLPGLGADSKLFIEQKKYFGDTLLTPPWISPEKGEPLLQFCQRYAESLSNRELVEADAVFIGGFSFGGMVALELAKSFSALGRLKVKGVILISSGRSKHILTDLFKIQAGLGSQLPDFLLRTILQKQMLHKFLKDEPLTAEQSACLTEMVESLDLDFFRWSLKACAQWDPGDKFVEPENEFPIFEIQGENDQIIPRSEEDGVITLKGAKHLIQYTHAKEINQWLEKITQNG